MGRRSLRREPGWWKGEPLPEETAEAAALSATPKKSPGMQTARIESLKRAIEQGYYRPLPEEIANALIREMTTEERPDLAGLEPGNMAPLDTLRAGSRGSEASGTVYSRPGPSAPSRHRTALHVASNGSFAENPEPARPTAAQDFSDGNGQGGEPGNEHRGEGQLVGGQQTTEETMNDEQMQMKDEPINRSA